MAVPWLAASARAGLTGRALLLLTALAAGVAAQGAFEQRPRLVVAALVAAAALVTNWAGTWRAVDTWLAAPAVALAAWAAAGGLRGDALAATSYAVTVSTCLLAVLVVRRTSVDERAVLLRGVTAIGTLVAMAGLAGVALHLEPLAFAAEGWWRSSAGLTYANATGCLLAACAAIALSSLGGPRPPAHVVAATVLVAGLLATFSRGAVLSLAFALVAVVALRGGAALRDAAPALAGGLLAGTGAVVSARAAADPRPAVAAAALAFGCALAVLLSRHRLSARVWSAAAVVAAAGAIAAVALVPALGSRVTLDSPRWAAWRAGLQELLAHPWTGVGPGRLWVVWEEDGAARGTSLLHNEYLQTAAELGLVGLLLLLLWGASLVAAVRPGLRRGASVAFAASISGVVAVLTGSAGDFYWHLTVLPLLAAVLAGAAVADCRPREPVTACERDLQFTDGAPAPRSVITHEREQMT